MALLPEITKLIEEIRALSLRATRPNLPLDQVINDILVSQQNMINAVKTQSEQSWINAIDNAINAAEDDSTKAALYNLRPMGWELTKGFTTVSATLGYLQLNLPRILSAIGKIAEVLEKIHSDPLVSLETLQAFMKGAVSPDASI